MPGGAQRAGGARITGLARHGSALHDAFAETREAWPGFGLHERFEQIVCLVLTVVVAGVAVASLAALLVRVAGLLSFGVVDPAEPAVFQAIFGMIVTVPIALEFNHTLLGVLGSACRSGAAASCRSAPWCRSPCWRSPASSSSWT